jgi:hypothetical protein
MSADIHSIIVSTCQQQHTQQQQPQAEPYKVHRVLTATLPDDATARQYNDLAWGAHGGRPALFAACSDRPRVDVLAFG